MKVLIALDTFLVILSLYMLYDNLSKIRKSYHRVNLSIIWGVALIVNFTNLLNLL
jgi:hypothetical protein